VNGATPDFSIIWNNDTRAECSKMGWLRNGRAEKSFPRWLAALRAGHQPAEAVPIVSVVAIADLTG
jgi:hypothetical protein